MTYITIIGGLIAASSLIIAKKPNAKELFDKIAPYQGFLGVVLFANGIWWLIQALPHLGAYFSGNLPFGVACLVAIVGSILVGFLLGYGLLSKFLFSKNEAAQEKAASTLTKLAKVQVPLGLVTAGAAVGTIVLA